MSRGGRRGGRVAWCGRVVWGSAATGAPVSDQVPPTHVGPLAPPAPLAPGPRPTQGPCACRQAGAPGGLGGRRGVPKGAVQGAHQPSAGPRGMCLLVVVAEWDCGLPSSLGPSPAPRSPPRPLPCLSLPPTGRPAAPHDRLSSPSCPAALCLPLQHPQRPAAAHRVGRFRRAWCVPVLHASSVAVCSVALPAAVLQHWL